MAEKINRYDRHEQQRNLGRKSREKSRKSRQKETSGTDVLWTAFEVKEMENAKQGIVSSVRNDTLTIMDNASIWNATLSENIPSKLRSKLVVGDRVFFEESKTETAAIITGRKPRTTTLLRFKGERNRASVSAQDEKIIATNVDIAVIVIAKCRPDFHPRFVDRYLVICENSGITPVVCINKSDLSEEIIPAIEWYRSTGISVIETSAETQAGIDTLKERLKGKIAVFVGNSGVGKSSLINSILRTAIETKEVSSKTGKGKHTTTASSLYNWDQNSYLIDTPGIRSLGVFHIDKLQLQYGFPEFDLYVNDCQYNDCTHSHEPVCGIISAVEQGAINRYRYESYIRMLEE